LAALPPPWLKKCSDDNLKILLARANATGTIQRKEKKKRLYSVFNKIKDKGRTDSAWK
jgi:hypothetical protein